MDDVCYKIKKLNLDPPSNFQQLTAELASTNRKLTKLLEKLK
jgi:hypothetical protein